MEKLIEKPAGNFSKFKKRELRKSQIREAALNKFSMSGYETTSLQDIADDLGITHAGLYYYYSNKADLLFDCVNFSLETMKIELASAANLSSCPKEALKYLIFAQIDIQFRIQHAVRLIDSVLFGTMSRSAHLNEIQLKNLRKLQKEIVGIYKTAIQNGIQSGEFKTRNPSIATLSLIGTISNVPYWFDPAGQISVDELKSIVCDMVFSGIGG